MTQYQPGQHSSQDTLETSKLSQVQAPSSGLQSFLKSLDQKQLETDGDLRQTVMSLLLTPRDDRVRRSALDALAPLVPSDLVVTSAIAMVAEGGERHDIQSSAGLRSQVVYLLGRKVLHDSYYSEESAEKKIARGAVLEALGDPSFQVRMQATSSLSSQVTRPKVYVELCRFLDPDSDIDDILKVNFEVRRHVARVLSRVVRVPYVRDTFVKALERPEPNFEVRTPLLNALSGLLEDSTYPLRLDDNGAMRQVLGRRDSTRSVQDIIQRVRLQVMVHKPDRFKEGEVIATQRSGASLESLLSDQPLMSLVYKHCGHLLKEFEPDPIFDTSHAWPLLSRRFLNEFDFRKAWVDRDLSLAVQKKIERVFRYELEVIEQRVKAGHEINYRMLGEMLSFVAWTQERAFDGAIRKLEGLSHLFSDEPASHEGFSVPELIGFVLQAADRFELDRRKGEVSFELRNETKLLGEEISGSRNPQKDFIDILSRYREALDLQVVSSESLGRLWRALHAYHRKDAQGFFETLSSVREQFPEYIDLIGAAIDKGRTEENQNLCLQAWTILRADKQKAQAILEQVAEEQLQQQEVEQVNEVREGMLNFSDSFAIRIRSMEKYSDYLLAGLEIYDRGLSSGLFDREVLDRLGSVLDSLYVAAPKRFLKAMEDVGRSRMSDGLKAALSIAVSEHSKVVHKQVSDHELSAALGLV